MKEAFEGQSLREADAGTSLPEARVLRLIEKGVMALSSGPAGPAAYLIARGDIDGLAGAFGGAHLHASVIQAASWRELAVEEISGALWQELLVEAATDNAQRIIRITDELTCALRHRLDARLARWLVNMQACQGGEPTIRIDQFLLARLLGVRRTTVNLESQRLRQLGAIQSIRGRIKIKDGGLLKTLSCGCGTAEP